MKTWKEFLSEGKDEKSILSILKLLEKSSILTKELGKISVSKVKYNHLIRSSGGYVIEFKLGEYDATIHPELGEVGNVTLTMTHGSDIIGVIESSSTNLFGGKLEMLAKYVTRSMMDEQ